MALVHTLQIQVFIITPVIIKERYNGVTVITVHSSGWSAIHNHYLGKLIEPWCLTFWVQKINIGIETGAGSLHSDSIIRGTL